MNIDSVKIGSVVVSTLSWTKITVAKIDFDNKFLIGEDDRAVHVSDCFLCENSEESLQDTVNEYKENEGCNFHLENSVLLAFVFGTESEQKNGIEMINHYDKIKYDDEKIRQYENDMIKKYFDNIRRLY